MAPINWALTEEEVAALPREQRKDRDDTIREIRRRMEKSGFLLGANDGSNKESLTNWLEGIERARLYCGANGKMAIELVGMLATGPLGRSVEAYLQDQELATWEQVKAEVFRLFMSEEERQQMRAKIAELFQYTYEDAKAYAMRFKLAAKRAYTQEHMGNPLIPCKSCWCEPL